MKKKIKKWEKNEKQEIKKKNRKMMKIIIRCVAHILDLYKHMHNQTPILKFCSC